jgi:hypothetical protein
MVRLRDGTAAAAIPAKIGADDRKVAGQQRRDATPHQVGLWKTVQQEERGSRAAATQKDRRLLCLKVDGFKIFKGHGMS